MSRQRSEAVVGRDGIQVGASQDLHESEGGRPQKGDSDEVTNYNRGVVLYTPI